MGVMHPHPADFLVSSWLYIQMILIAHRMKMMSQCSSKSWT